MSRCFGASKQSSPLFKTYTSWRTMKQRCYNPNKSTYSRYGARGITVCNRWLGVLGFKHFLEDMGVRPPYMSLDRINNDGNYSPENCRWATNSIQKLSKHNVILYEGITLSDYCKLNGINYTGVWQRINKGWSVNKAVETPLRKKARVLL